MADYLIFEGGALGDSPAVERSADGLPGAWRLLRTGENLLTKDGKPYKLTLSGETVANMAAFARDLKRGSLIMRYGNRELSGTIAEKCDSLNRFIRNALLASIKDCNFLNRSGNYIMEDLSIGNLEVRLVAHGTLLYGDKLDEAESSVHFQIKGWNFPHLPVKLSGDVSDAEHLLNSIRKLVYDKPKELANSRTELEAKTARLAKLQSTPEDEFSAAKEKSALSVELEQIIFELNKTSEGQRRH